MHYICHIEMQLTYVIESIGWYQGFVALSILIQYCQNSGIGPSLKSRLLPLLYEISGARHLAQLGLTTSKQADKIQVDFKFLKINCRSRYSTFCWV